MDLSEWPHEYKEKVIVGNKTSNIGIATLWSIKEEIAEHLNKDDYCIVANYYDVYNGLEPMLRNCLSNPNIRYILIVGADKSNSKNTLLNFFNLGIEKDLVKGTDVSIPKDIPIEYLEIVRKSITLIDLTDKVSDIGNFEEWGKVLNEKINCLSVTEPYGEPKLFPKTPDVIEIYPSDNNVYTVKDDYISKVWLKILNTVNSYGTKTWTSHEESSEVRECINLVSVIQKEDPDFPKMEEYFRFSKEDVLNYYKEFCTNYVPDGTSYTYGSRFRGDGDQIDAIVKKLQENYFSKRCFAITWKYSDLNNDTPPCVISFQANIQSNILYATSYIRSNDMFRAWPLNAFGLRKIQKNICEKLECKMGPLTIISQSAHIYKENHKQTKTILDKYFTDTNCFYDPRGYYTIELKDNSIYVKHYSPTSKQLKEYTGKTSREINDQINTSQHPVDPYHSTYLGEEIMKAEIALKLGLAFVQDNDLDFSKIKIET